VATSIGSPLPHPCRTSCGLVGQHRRVDAYQTPADRLHRVSLWRAARRRMECRMRARTLPLSGMVRDDMVPRSEPEADAPSG